MKYEKYAYITPILAAVITSPIHGLRIIIIIFCLLDISFGVYTAIVMGDGFNFGRFLHGILKCIIYLIILWATLLVNTDVFSRDFGGMELLIPKVVTLGFILLEIESMDKKRVRLGKRPLLQTIRGWIKVAKELFTSVKKIDD